MLVLRRAGRRAGAARGEWWAVPRVNCGRVELWDWGAAGWAKPECGLGLGYRDMRINERAGGGGCWCGAASARWPVESGGGMDDS